MTEGPWTAPGPQPNLANSVAAGGAEEVCQHWAQQVTQLSGGEIRYF